MTWSPIETFCGLLIIGDIYLILACLFRGRSLKRLCRFGLWLNGILLALALVPLVLVLSAMQTSSEAGLALLAVLMLPAPFLVGFLALVAIYRWRMRAPGDSARSQ